MRGTCWWRPRAVSGNPAPLPPPLAFPCTRAAALPALLPRWLPTLHTILCAEGGPTLDLYALTEQLTAAGLHAPLLFRFLPIVGHRIAKLNVRAPAAAAASKPGLRHVQLGGSQQHWQRARQLRRSAAVMHGRPPVPSKPLPPPLNCNPSAAFSAAVKGVEQQMCRCPPTPCRWFRCLPQAAFSAAIERFEYQGAYNGVFPVKANHDKSLIDAVLEYGARGGCCRRHACRAAGSWGSGLRALDGRLLRHACARTLPPTRASGHPDAAVPHLLSCRCAPPCPRFLAGEPHQFGLEVGSKAELVMVMARLAGTGRRGVNLVCNGFKDAEYMELVGAGATGGSCSNMQHWVRRWLQQASSEPSMWSRWVL